MSTGLETWTQNLNDLGPLYPFVGTEGILAIVGIGSWIVWHLIQMSSEGKTMEQEKQHFSDKARLEKAMHVAHSETLASNMDDHGSDYK